MSVVYIENIHTLIHRIEIQQFNNYTYHPHSFKLLLSLSSSFIPKVEEVTLFWMRGGGCLAKKLVEVKPKMQSMAHRKKMKKKAKDHDNSKR